MPTGIVRVNRPPSGGWTERWEVPSKSNPSSAHIVALHRNGYWGCDCWPWRKNRTDCSHIKALLVVRNRHEADLSVVTVDQPNILTVEKFDKISSSFANFEM